MARAGLIAIITYTDWQASILVKFAGVSCSRERDDLFPISTAQSISNPKKREEQVVLIPIPKGLKYAELYFWGVAQMVDYLMQEMIIHRELKLEKGEVFKKSILMAIPKDEVIKFLEGLLGKNEKELLEECSWLSEFV